MAEKVTTMVLKVDLQCPSCYRKIKKVLAKFPQIRSQAYDEKQNMVTITVVCCSPEKIRDKLCCKGGKTIKTIEIKPPTKKPPTEKPPTEKPPTEKPPTEKPPTEKPPTEKPPTEKPPTEKPPGPPVCVPVPVCCGQCYEGIPGGPCYKGYGRPPTEKPPGPPVCVPVPVCCGQCYEGIPGGPCYKGYGRPPTEKPPGPPVCVPIPVCCGQCKEGIPGGPCYKEYGRPVPSYDGYGYGGNRACYGVSRCDEYFNEENTSGCTIM